MDSNTIHKKLLGIWFYIIGTSPIYIIISHLVLSSDEKPMVDETTLLILRIALAVASVITIAGGVFIRKHMLSREKLFQNASVFEDVLQKYVSFTTTSFALFELPALMGLLLTIAGRNIIDVYIFCGIALVFLILAMPSKMKLENLARDFEESSQNNRPINFVEEQ